MRKIIAIIVLVYVDGETIELIISSHFQHHKVISNNESTKRIVHEKHERHERILLLFVLFVSFVDSIFFYESDSSLGCFFSGIT